MYLKTCDQKAIFIDFNFDQKELIEARLENENEFLKFIVTGNIMLI